MSSLAVAAAAFGVYCTSPVLIAVEWAISRRCRNRAMHAAHGNGGPPWQPAGRPPGEARLLQDLHPWGKLRAAGWRVLADVPDIYMLRLYDTRIETRWLAGLAQELIGNSAPSTYVIGGDFLSQPALEDGAALHPTDLRRWGPAGEDAYCLLVPPRPHVAVWAQRCVSQMRVEAAGTISCCVRWYLETK